MKKATLADLLPHEIIDDMVGLCFQIKMARIPISSLPLYVLNNIALQVIAFDKGIDFIMDSNDMAVTQALTILSRRAKENGLSIF